MDELEQLKKQVEDQRKQLESVLFKYGYESPNESPTFDELIGFVLQMGDALNDKE